MKILVISHMYPSTFNDVYGIFVHEQVKALINHGIEARVISPVPWAPFPVNIFSDKWKRYSRIPEYKDWEGIPVWYPRYLTFPKAYLFESSGERMYKGIKKIVPKIYIDFKFDLIHAHSALPDGYAAMKLAKDFNVPFVVTIHGQDAQQTLFKNKQCRRNVLKVIELANKIILVSNKLNRIIKKYYEEKNHKFGIIPNGVNVEDVLKIKIIRPKDTENNLVLSVSNLIKTKGLDYNLNALSKLVNKYTNLKYIIIGEGAEKKKLQELSRELGIYDKVEFLGMLTHDEVIKQMSRADIFSLPSWNEAFGVVYIEAMACGKPVIGCRGEGIEDFVEDGKTGMLVKPKDVDSLAEAIDYLLSNPEKAKVMGERARKLVLENYTWEKNAEKTIKVYQEVLNNVR